MTYRKTKIRFRIYSFIIMGFSLMLASNCKKDLSNAVIHIGEETDTSFHPAYVEIGTQVWMSKNLKTRRFLNGDKIRTTNPATLDITDEVMPKHQWAYDADEINVDTYGRLYTWYAITDPRGLCPRGWHIPTDEDWDILITYLNGKLNKGGSLKETGTTHWSTTNPGATNETYFTALPGGYRLYYGMFSDIGFSGFWWSSSESSEFTAWGRGMMNYNNQVPRLEFEKQNGLSVRCIKDN
jgi:uncharacterized protein (TIGR02145 family)